METSDSRIVLVTDQHPYSGIGVYAGRLYDLLHPSFPNLELANLHYFHFPDVGPHRPIAGQRYAPSRAGAMRVLHQNERTFARGLSDSGTLVHLCGASYELAVRVSRPIATVHDFGLRSLRSLRATSSKLLPVEAFSFFELVRTPRFLRRCKELVAISELTQQILVRRTGLQSVVIHHWADESRFHPRAKEEARSALGLPLNRKIVLNVSAGTANKNLTMLRSVVEALPEEYLLVKVGFPLSGDSAHVRNEGMVSEAQYPYYFNAADVYVHTSITEGFGRPLLEAMGSGLPIVALANPPAPEILGAAGVLVPPPAEPGEMASAVRSVLETSALAIALGARGRSRAEEFRPAVAAELYRETYLRALRN
jgi:glycosyltransferase involved in cell wall biosynthesis